MSYPYVIFHNKQQRPSHGRGAHLLPHEITPHPQAINARSPQAHTRWVSDPRGVDEDGRRRSIWLLVALWPLVIAVVGYLAPNPFWLIPVTEPRYLVPNLAYNWLIEPLGLLCAAAVGVLMMGSEFGWHTLRTLLTQQPNRCYVFGAKVIVTALVLAALVTAALATALGCSIAVSAAQHRDTTLCALRDLLGEYGALYAMCAACACMGVALGLVVRSAAFAIVAGIAYVLIVDPALGAFADDKGNAFGQAVYPWLLGVNSHHLIAAPSRVGVLKDAGSQHISAAHAAAVLVAYCIAFLAVAVVAFTRRDVPS